jgi:hypothetical protein
MKFATTAAAAAVLATSGASAQLSSPMQLLQYGSRLLTAECRDAVTGLVSGSELSQCLQVNNLLPILNNGDTSVIPNINDYLTGLCSADACNQTTIDNATELVTTACATDLSRFGVTEDVVRFVMNAYPTAREVACLSTNDTELVNANGTSMTSNSSSNSSTFCPTALLYKAQDYLGANFTNSYIDSLILGANATAYQQILAVPRNGSLLTEFGCNDCVAAGLEVVIRDYPQLENKTFQLDASNVEEYTNYTLSGLNQTERDNNTWTVARLYEGFCDVDVLANSSLPASINSTAYNSTEESMTMSAPATVTTTLSTSVIAGATSAATAAASVTPSAMTSVMASATSLAAPVASATSAVASAVASVIPIPSQILSELAGVSSAAAAPTKRWVKWE